MKATEINIFILMISQVSMCKVNMVAHSNKIINSSQTLHLPPASESFGQ